MLNGTVTGMPACYTVATRSYSGGRSSENWNGESFLRWSDLPSELGTGTDGVVKRLTVIGLVEVVWNGYLLTFEISQHLASRKLFYRIPCVFIGSVSVPMESIQVLSIFDIAMSSTFVDLVIDDRVYDKFFYLIIFLVFRICSPVRFDTTAERLTLVCFGCGFRGILFRLLGGVLMVAVFVMFINAGNDVFHVGFLV